MVCRTTREKRELLRMVRLPDQTVVFDPTGRAPGRGAYVCRTGQCVESGLAKGRLSAALAARIDESAAAELRAAADGAGIDRGR